MLDKLKNESQVRLKLRRNEFLNQSPGTYIVRPIGTSRNRMFYLESLTSANNDQKEDMILLEESYGVTWEVEVIE